MNARNRWTSYAIAAAGLVAATLVRGVLHPALGTEFPFITYLVLVILLARMASVGPSLAAATAGGALGVHFFVPVMDAASRADLVRYGIICAAMIAICEIVRRTEKRADEQAAVLVAATDSALDCIVTIDTDDRIVEFNRSAERTFGRRRGEVIGRGLAETLIPERLRKRHREALARHLESGETTILGRRVELPALRADGSEFPVELTVTRMELGGRTLFTAFIRDLSEVERARTALAEVEQRYSSLVAQLTDYAIFTLDLEGRASSWNEGVLRVLGFESGEFVGRDVTPAIFTPEDFAAGVPQRELETAARDGTSSNDRWMRRKDGTRFFAAGVTVARRDAAGALVGYAKIMRDQTTRKEMENRLRQTASDLAEAMEKQSRFLAVLSHELRNPMAALRNAVEVLRLRARDGPPDSMVDLVSRQVTHMGHLIDDLLDAARIRSGRIQLRRERMDLVAAVREAMEVAKAQCAPLLPGLTMEASEEALWIDADPTRIVQIVGNLVHNACKFTPAGGRVTVRVRRGAGMAEVAVADTGIGIAADHLKTVFEMFEQVDGVGVRTHGGLGIGLTVVKSLVEMHGGTIEARSDGPGRGAEFVVRLPLAPARVEPVDNRAAAPAARVDSLRVLVLDDNVDAAETLTLVLQLHGHMATTVHDGESAVEAFRRERPEVALLDIGLPGISGYEVARRIRALPGGAEAVLVAVTGWGQEEDRRRTREAGFDAHLTKPVDYDNLAALLDKLTQVPPRKTGT